MDIRHHTNYCGCGRANVGTACASAWGQAVRVLQLAMTADMLVFNCERGIEKDDFGKDIE